MPVGVYTVRMTDNGKVSEEKIAVGLDPRNSFTAADRQANFDAVLKGRALFDRMSDLVDHIKGLQMLAGQRMQGLPDGDPIKAQLAALIGKAGDLRKQIVATKEGGAITGEIRIRENADDVYGALMSYEGAYRQDYQDGADRGPVAGTGRRVPRLRRPGGEGRAGDQRRPDQEGPAGADAGGDETGGSGIRQPVRRILRPRRSSGGDG